MAALSLPQLGDRGAQRVRAPFAPTVVLAVALIVGVGLVLISAVILVVTPTQSLGVLGGLVNQQNQSAKTALYILLVVVVLPGAVVVTPRIADRALGGAGAFGLGAASGALVIAEAVLLFLARLSAGLPWRDGVATTLVAGLVWCVLAAVVLRRAGAPWPALARLAVHRRALGVTAGALAFVVVLCVTHIGSLSPAGLSVGIVAAVAVLLLARVPPAALGPAHRALGPAHRALGPAHRALGSGLDVVLVVLIALAVPDLVIFHPSLGPPSAFFPPGLVQSQHDFYLGAINQVMSGPGTLLVNAPGSQYGVGSLYFLAGWFHLVGLGYGTFGLLDGILTALFYVGAYLVLRLSGVSRTWAAGALAVAVLAFVYHLEYRVGVLPEMGPLRFGMPMITLLGAAMTIRGPRARPLGLLLTYGSLGVSSVWAVETFGFTLVTLACLLAAEAWTRPVGSRRRWLGRRAAGAALACLLVHLLFALGILIGSGQLPHWGQYFAYVHSFLLGGQAGQVTYGFARWSPGLALGAAALASAAGVILLPRRAPALALSRAPLFVTLAGASGYAVVLLGYVDSRSSTYLLPYLALPALIAAVLWLTLYSGVTTGAAAVVRLGPLAIALAVTVLMFAAAWPEIGGRLGDTALAHAYPGGGLLSSVRRLRHEPPIDPRTPLGQQLLDRYVPGPRPIVLLAASPDLATEILMRRGVANGLDIGDPGMDSYVPSNWTPLIGPEIDRLHAGTRVLMDAGALSTDRYLRARPGIDPIEHPLVLGGTELEWILERINRRFTLVPVAPAADGFVIARLVSRGNR